VKTSNFSFNLPESSIAQQPSPYRGGSRLMVLKRDTGEIVHTRFKKLPAYVKTGTVMVLNRTRVINARLFATAEDSGGRVEFILLRELGPGLWKTLAAKARKQRPGRKYGFPDGVAAQVVEEADLPRFQLSGEQEHRFVNPAGDPRIADPGLSQEGFRYLRFTPPIDAEYLQTYGHVPLPPYIRRQETHEDTERYQTVYAEDPGSAAAPTAGLHFTRELLADLERKGVIPVKLTLHVGAGTFLPIRAEQVEKHRMHEEHYHIPPESADRINAALREKRTILAVGTTVVRALESAYSEELHGIVAGTRSTSLFIYPGYRFKVVSRLLTNFHTPRSSLLVLVSAFAGRERILTAYETAVREGYRFFSYGDAMLIV
jgi:S-adenosylmethionine:tRNA ribosyltransferase-isomerase